MFADVVRDAQKQLGINDSTAHDLALQAMRQFAIALQAIVTKASAVEIAYVGDIRSNNCTSGVWIWDPCDPTLDDYPVPRDWRVSSGSLGLWLCGRLTNSRLSLVKWTSPRGQDLSVSGLSSERFVDEYFPNLWNEHQCATWWLEKSQTDLLFGLLDREE